MDPEPALPLSLPAPQRHLFLSPHYDDIPLSAGATVRLLADHGLTPETLVVFGAQPDPHQPLTPFARELHDAWGLEANDVIASRRAEENAAAAILGAQTGVLPFLDAIYRGDHYLSDDDLFGTPAAAEWSLPAQIAASLGLAATPDPSTRIYAPLGIGRHVDHQHVFLAAMELETMGWDVWFYEDIPYAMKPGAFDARMADLAVPSLLKPAAVVPAGSAWDTKLDAIMNYHSQLETVFRTYVGVGTSRHEIAAALASYARNVAHGTLGERFWRISAAPDGDGS